MQYAYYSEGVGQWCVITPTAKPIPLTGHWQWENPANPSRGHYHHQRAAR